MSFGETYRLGYKENVGDFTVFLGTSPASKVLISLTYKGRNGVNNGFYETDFFDLQIVGDNMASTAVIKCLGDIRKDLGMGERILNSRETYKNLETTVAKFINQALEEHEKLV